MQKKIKYISAVIFLLLANNVFAQSGITQNGGSAGNTTITGFFDWQKKIINTTISVNLSKIKIPQPTGRIQAEELLATEYMEKIRPVILSLQVDSSSVLGDFVDSGYMSSAVIDEFAGAAKHLPAHFTYDLKSISSSYTLDLKDVSANFLNHKRSSAMTYPLTTISTIDYTGIIIIANESLPVHGKYSEANLVPCLFPKIWDTEMNLIFDKIMVDPNDRMSIINWTSADKIFQKTPSGIDPELAKIVGHNPLRIIASEVFGITPTDPVIDARDALLILSSQSNKKLLQTGKVAIVVSDSTLTKTLNNKL
jgi:hypothetical protein